MTARALALVHPLRDARRGAARTTLGGRVAARADLVIRRALERDATTLRRLAELDGAPPLPDGERLLAEIDGRPVAAIDVRTGRVVSDPFVPTAAAADLLALRAGQVRS